MLVVGLGRVFSVVSFNVLAYSDETEAQCSWMASITYVDDAV